MTISTAYVQGMGECAKAWPLTPEKSVNNPYPTDHTSHSEFQYGFEFAAKVLTVTSLMRQASTTPTQQPARMTKNGLYEGQKVHKKESYGFPGVIVSIFNKQDGQERMVVECTADGVKGMLHLFNPEQFEPMTDPYSA